VNAREPRQYPRTISDAVSRLGWDLDLELLARIAGMKEDELPQVDSFLCVFIRKKYGLDAGNDALLRATRAKTPDDAGRAIIRALWQNMQNIAASFSSDPSGNPFADTEDEPDSDCVQEEEEFELSSEVHRYFDPSSLPANGKPTAVILMGGIAAGKTTVRKQEYSKGYVLVDAAEIFTHLGKGEFSQFPGAWEEPMELLGQYLAKRAVSERRNLVTEIVGADIEPVEQLIHALRGEGYNVQIAAVTCDIAQAEQRHASRPPFDVSALDAEPFNISWLLAACTNSAGHLGDESSS